MLNCLGEAKYGVLMKVRPNPAACPKIACYLSILILPARVLSSDFVRELSCDSMKSAVRGHRHLTDASLLCSISCSAFLREQTGLLGWRRSRPTMAPQHCPRPLHT